MFAKKHNTTDSAFANEALRPAVCKLVLFTDAFANKTISFANAYILRLVCKRRLSFANAAILQTQTNIYIECACALDLRLLAGVAQCVPAEQELVRVGWALEACRCVRGTSCVRSFQEKASCLVALLRLRRQCMPHCSLKVRADY